MPNHILKSLPLVAYLVLSFLVAGCSEQGEPTGLAREVSLGVNTMTVESGALDDALGRIIPSLSDETKAAQLANAFHDLSAALSGIDPRSINGQVTRARAALDSYRDAGGEAADLDALNMALEAVVVRVESVLRQP